MIKTEIIYIPKEKSKKIIWNFTTYIGWSVKYKYLKNMS